MPANKPKPPPNTISPEAQAFIRDAVLPGPRFVDPATIGAVRQEAHDRYAPDGAAVAQACGVSVRQSTVGGVPVEIVAPDRLEPSRADALLLYFFGGGHIVGSPEEDLMIIAKLAAFIGITVYAPRYRLAPEHPYPAAVDDAAAVYAALIEKQGGGKVALAGESAGGNLTLALLQRALDRSWQLPCAVALMSPWTDLTGGSDSQSTNRGCDPTYSSEDNGGAEAKAYAKGTPFTDPMISPVLRTDWSGLPPTLITTGTRDMLLSDSARMAQALRRSGVDVQLNVWEGMWHVFEAYPGIPEAEQSLEEIADYIAAQI